MNSRENQDWFVINTIPCPYPFLLGQPTPKETSAKLCIRYLLGLTLFDQQRLPSFQEVAQCSTCKESVCYIPFETVQGVNQQV
jgi:hypothetical protein